jgi:hypothetical protein
MAGAYRMGDRTDSKTSGQPRNADRQPCPTPDRDQLLHQTKYKPLPHPAPTHLNSNQAIKHPIHPLLQPLTESVTSQIIGLVNRRDVAPSEVVLQQTE